MRRVQLMTSLVFLVLFHILLAEAKPVHPPCGSTNLKKVKTCGNGDLTRIPTEWGSLAEEHGQCFETLNVGKNQIRSVSQQEIFDIPCRASIQVLYLFHNKIPYLPLNVFEGLTNLTVLDLSSNQLTDIRHQFCHIQTLTELTLDDNHGLVISAASFKCLKNLKYLSLKNCSIRSLPKEFLKGSKLEYLDLSGNYIDNFVDIDFPPNLKLVPPEHPVEEPTSTSTSLGTVDFNVNSNRSTTIATNSTITDTNATSETTPNQDEQITQGNTNLWSSTTPNDQTTSDNVITTPRNLNQEEQIRQGDTTLIFCLSLIIVVVVAIFAAGIWSKKHTSGSPARNSDEKNATDEDKPLNTTDSIAISESVV